MFLGQIIREKREQLNLTLDEVSNKIGFSKPYLSTIETGKVKNPPSDEMLTKLEATPVGMPVPAVPEALTKGVINGTTIPWEVTLPLKVPELVKNHTSFSGDYGLYTLAFAFVMNKSAYDNLPDDLKKIIDDNSGVETAAAFGRAMDEGDKVGKAKAEKMGNNIVVLDEAETERWKKVSQTVIEEWIAEMKEKGVDGEALVADARALIEKYSK